MAQQDGFSDHGPPFHMRTRYKIACSLVNTRGKGVLSNNTTGRNKAQAQTLDTIPVRTPGHP